RKRPAAFATKPVFNRHTDLIRRLHTSGVAISIPCRHRRGRLASVHARLEAPLEEMKDSTSPRSPQWSTAPSAKTKNVVQRSVTALLDALAPERVLKRVEQLQGAVEQ